MEKSESGNWLAAILERVTTVSTVNEVVEQTEKLGEWGGFILSVAHGGLAPGEHGQGPITQTLPTGGQ